MIKTSNSKENTAVSLKAVISLSKVGDSFTALPLRVQPGAGLLNRKILKQKGRLDYEDIGLSTIPCLCPPIVRL